MGSWSAHAALHTYTGDHIQLARIPLDPGRARGGTQTCPPPNLHHGKDASRLACSPCTPAMMMLCDPELDGGTLCPCHITGEIHPYLPSNLNRGANGGNRGWHLSSTLGSLTFQHCGRLAFLLIKSSSPRSTRDHRRTRVPTRWVEVSSLLPTFPEEMLLLHSPFGLPTLHRIKVKL